MCNVKAEGLTKAFRDESRGLIKAVDCISFRCHSSEIFGLLGANGAGKTTLLRMLATLLNPTSGKAWVMGHDVSQNGRYVRESIGFYSSGTALYPRLTARETVEFFCRINNYPKEQVHHRVQELIQRFELGEWADTRVENLSQGLRQRVSIARAVAHDPPVLIFDEPTVGLDVVSASHMHNMLKELREEGKTVLFSSHIMGEVQRLCDRIAILHRGRLLHCDTLEGLREASGKRYLDDILLHFMGEADNNASQREVMGADDKDQT